MPEPELSPIEAFDAVRAQLRKLTDQRKEARERVTALQRQIHEGAEQYNEQQAEAMVEAVLDGRDVPELSTSVDELRAAERRRDAVEGAVRKYKAEHYEPAHRRAKRYASREVRDQHRANIRRQMDLVAELSDLITAEELLRTDLGKRGLLDEQVLPASSFPNVSNRHAYGTPANTWLRWLSQHGYGFED